VLQADARRDARIPVRRGGKAHPRVRAILDGDRRARVDGYGTRCSGIRGEVLHRRRQLGPRR
jgi:hypothetical protein